MPLSRSPILETICALACAKETSALYQFLNTEGVCIDVSFAKLTPVYLLAREGNWNAVQFLIHQFGANRDLAVEGFATGGHFAAVTQLLEEGADRDIAARGLAQGGHITLRELQEDDADLDKAVQGFARGGYTAAVETLLAAQAHPLQALKGYIEGGHAMEARNFLRTSSRLRPDHALESFAEVGDSAEVEQLLDEGLNPNLAIRGFARGGHIAEVEKLLANGGDPVWAVLGYIPGGYISQVDTLTMRVECSWARFSYLWGKHLNLKTILPLLATIKNDSLRPCLTEQMQKLNPSVSSAALLGEGNRIREAMQVHELSFHQVASLSTIDNRIWFLQSPQLLEPGRLVNDEVFSVITSFLTELPIEAANRMHQDSHRFFSRLSGYNPRERRALTPSGTETPSLASSRPGFIA